MKSKKELLTTLNHIATEQNKISRNFEFLDLFEELVSLTQNVKGLNDNKVTERFLLIKQSLLSKICRFWDDEDDHLLDLAEVCVELGDWYNKVNANKSVKYYNLGLEGYNLLVQIDRHDEGLLEKYAVEINKICNRLSEISTKYTKSKIVELYPCIAGLLQG